MLPGLPSVRKAPHRPADYLRGARGLDLRSVAALAMAPKADLPATRRMNDRLLELGRTRSGLFYPVCSVHPLDGPEALSEIDRVAVAGAKGLKLHPNTQQFDVADPGVAAVVARAAEHRLPVLFDA
ncbi:MAG: amidohydrolase family protein, partial [Thermoplasmata archaeon]|nr:amidohydrolase family protein [Thermoplasmata archaeon]